MKVRSFGCAPSARAHAQLAIQAPSIGRAAPLISLPPGLHRNAIKFATSSAGMNRPLGCRAAMYSATASASEIFLLSARASIRDWILGVRIVPGQMALQVTPDFAVSNATVRVTPSSAVL